MSDDLKARIDHFSLAFSDDDVAVAFREARDRIEELEAENENLEYYRADAVGARQYMAREKERAESACREVIRLLEPLIYEPAPQPRLKGALAAARAGLPETKP